MITTQRNTYIISQQNSHQYNTERRSTLQYIQENNTPEHKAQSNTTISVQHMANQQYSVQHKHRVDLDPSHTIPLWYISSRWNTLNTIFFPFPEGFASCPSSCIISGEKKSNQDCWGRYTCTSTWMGMYAEMIVCSCCLLRVSCPLVLLSVCRPHFTSPITTLLRTRLQDHNR